MFEWLAKRDSIAKQQGPEPALLQPVKMTSHYSDKSKPLSPVSPATNQQTTLPPLKMNTAR